MTYPVSPSSIDAFECERKGAGQYIAKWPREQNASAALGSELHGIAEPYLIKGTQPDEFTKAGNLFVRGLPYLPPPGSGDVEGKRHIELDGVPYVLVIDYRGRKVPGFGGKRVVLDHKTSKNPKKYGLWGKPAFLQNPQSVLYSTYDIIQADDDEANLRWLYYRTSGSPKAEPSDCTLTRTELEDVFEDVVGSKAKRILHLRTVVTDPNELDPNTDVCDKYGGCPYHPRAGGQCTVTKTQQIRGAVRQVEKKETTMAEGNLLARIAARKAAAAAGGGASAPEEKEDKINPPEAQEEKAEETPAPAERPSARRKAAAPIEPSSDAPSDADIGRVVRFLLGK